MYQIDFKKPIHIHFIGIGGISMSGLAEILLEEGFTVSGSDREMTMLTDRLMAGGAVISCPQSAGNITPDIDAVVYTAAIQKDNPEYAAAKAAGIPLLSRTARRLPLPCSPTSCWQQRPTLQFPSAGC